ncbi:hypothetical protein [uncultured Muribaculum sp.]|uniref:hypothetical protein n=1 Tax=uncultured Muribaculum sp. TaxID=1918613 RepID=UPI002591F767|nr:hypothetical protein [uncultured Muribaculum sp.]
MNQNNSNALTWVVTAGMVLIVVGVLMPILGYSILVSRWIFCGGAAVNLIGRIFVRYKGENIRIKRLFRLEFWAAVFFCVSGFFQFYSPATSDWLAFTLAGGAILVYTSIMIPRLSKKSGEAE